MLNFFGMMDWSNMMGWGSGMTSWTGFSVLGWFLGFGILGIVVAVALTLFWLWMLIDLLQRKTPDKLAWVLVLIFLNILGAVLYYFLVFAKGKRR